MIVKDNCHEVTLTCDSTLDRVIISLVDTNLTCNIPFTPVRFKKTPCGLHELLHWLLHPLKLLDLASAV